MKHYKNYSIFQQIFFAFQKSVLDYEQRCKKITLASDNSHTGKPFQAIWTLCLYFDMMCYVCFGDVLLPDNTKAIPYFPCTLGKGSVIVRAWLTAILSQDSI